MSTRPNILFLMADQLQRRMTDSDHPCRTPTFSRLADRGMRFERAYTSNAVCSPARAGIMTGLLPHNHGVLEVTHCVDDDQSRLRDEHPHWAQRLRDAGYRTGFFGKWHIERSGELDRYGWEVNGMIGGERFNARKEAVLGEEPPEREFVLRRNNKLPHGYNESLLYGVVKDPPEHRPMGLVTDLAEEFLRDVTGGEEPWCCYVSVPEPHDPFVCGEKAFHMYDVDSMELPPNAGDEMADKPRVYKKAARTWSDMIPRERREAMACYYASITEIDSQFGRLIDLLESRGELDNTLIVLTTDHGELLGAHGLYCKNYSPFEEIYNVPLIVCGPGVARGVPTHARVGTHELCPTLLEMTGLEPIETADARSFAPALRDPAGSEGDFTTGYAEYHGTRFKLTQRIYWDGPWKFAFNGFDIDELYNLDDDPWERTNLAGDPAYAERVSIMMAGVWKHLRDTGDHSVLNSQYPILRVAPVGPGVVQD